MAVELRLMRTYARKTSIIALLGVALSGCTSAEWSSIHRSHQLGDDQVRTLISDAKQRIVLTKIRAELKKDSGSSIIGTDRVVCAEPSPDVAQAVSSSISAAFQKTGAGGQGLSVNAAAKFGESVAQLGERMAVIQLIRDKMYRACEAYANGAVDKAAYTLMLARLDKTMVTLLSQEMAAGAFGRALAVAYSSPGGPDPAVIDKLSAEAEAKINAIGTDVEAQKTQKPAATKALTELSAAAKAGGGGGASGSGGGSIGNRPSGGDLATAGKTIHAIYRDYVDDDGTEPLVDACLIALNSSGIETNSQLTTEYATADKDARAAAKSVEEAKKDLEKAQADLKNAQLTVINDIGKLLSGHAEEDAAFTNLNPETKEKIETLKTAQSKFGAAKAIFEKAEARKDDAAIDIQAELIQKTMKRSVFGAYCINSVLNFGRDDYVHRRIQAEKNLRILEKFAKTEDVNKQLVAHDKRLQNAQACLVELQNPKATDESKAKACEQE